MDHEPLVSLYNSNSKCLPVRVAKDRSKLRGFNFEVVWEPGTTTPADYGSHNPPPMVQYTKLEKDELDIEDEEEDSEIIVNRVKELTDAIILDVLKNETMTYQSLKEYSEEIRKGKLRPALKEYEEIFIELSLSEGAILQGDRLVIPNSASRCSQSHT